MKIAVVGSTGVLGCALVPLLVEQGYVVRALARSIKKAQTFLSQGVEIVECDLLSPNVEEHMAPMLDGCETVVHIATSIPRDFTAPNAWEANTRLRTDVVKILLKASLGVGVKRYVQQSITMAYPDYGEDWITEDAPLDMSSDREWVCAPVVAMEEMVRNVSPEELQWCILRGGTFVGPGTFQDRMIENLRAGKEVVPCDGRNFISLIHVSDMATAIVAALMRAPTGSVFNIVDEPIRQGEYSDRLAASVGVARPRRDEDAKCPNSWRCSNQAAKSVLEWLPKHNIIPE
ncbi:MAG: hypothetical protein FOGNACKC_06296 [Anaerolineae bacterium]|nr:hypothetical protein [Anaerolineae bacterium]